MNSQVARCATAASTVYDDFNVLCVCQPKDILNLGSARLDSHSVRALLASRALLVKIKRDLENQIRGLLKNLGLVIGRAKFNVFAVRADELIAGRPELLALLQADIVKSINCVLWVAGRSQPDLDTSRVSRQRFSEASQRSITHWPCLQSGAPGEISKT